MLSQDTNLHVLQESINSKPLIYIESSLRENYSNSKCYTSRINDEREREYTLYSKSSERKGIMNCLKIVKKKERKEKRKDLHEAKHGRSCYVSHRISSIFARISKLSEKKRKRVK